MNEGTAPPQPSSKIGARSFSSLELISISKATETNPAKRTPKLADIVDSGSSLAKYTLRRVILYVTPFSLTAPSSLALIVDVYLGAS